MTPGGIPIKNAAGAFLCSIMAIADRLQVLRCRVHHQRSRLQTATTGSGAAIHAAVVDGSAAVTGGDVIDAAATDDILVPDLDAASQPTGGSPNRQLIQDSPSQEQQQQAEQQAEQPPNDEELQEQQQEQQQQQQPEPHRIQPRPQAPPPQVVPTSTLGFAVQAANLRALQAGLAPGASDAEAQQQHRRCRPIELADLPPVMSMAVPHARIICFEG